MLRTRYLHQLDSLRAIAILTVIIVHWFPKNSLLYIIADKINAPAIFFTLSGFLITSILLKERAKAEIAGINKFILFKNFFFKRALRIFPGYYLVIAIFYFFRPITKEVIDFRYFISFTSNIYINKLQQWPALAHLWSMSVEEQFYLIWPFLMLFIRKKYLMTAIICFIIGGIISQFLTLTGENNFSGIITTNCIDELAIGALLSWATIIQPKLLQNSYKTFSVVAFTTLLLLIIQTTLDTFLILNNQTLTSILTAWLIVFFLKRGERKEYLFSFLFESKTLMTLGKISYGLYLYHFLIPYYTYPWFLKTLDFFHLPALFASNSYIWILSNFCLLLIVSTLSYRFFEMPILKLKKHFEIKMPKVQPKPIISDVGKEYSSKDHKVREVISI